MQTLGRASLDALKIFIDNPSRQNAQRLSGVPVLYNILEKEYRQLGVYSSDTQGLCHWMYQRGREVCEAVLATNVDDLEKRLTPNFGRLREWEKVSIKLIFFYLLNYSPTDRVLLWAPPDTRETALSTSSS